MEILQIALFAAAAAGAVALGVVANVLRKRTAIPARVRLLPFLLAGLVVAGGILGALVGIWTAFGAVGDAPPETKATLLARGISEAMNCTAFAVVFALAFGCGVTTAEMATRRRR